MKRTVHFLALALLLVVASSAVARFVDVWPFAKMFEKSDFVVIAKVVVATRETSEHSTLKDIQEPVIGVVTEFQTLLVLKGQQRERFVLHHYRLVPSDVALVNGPSLLTFDPKSDHRPYLLFLTREPDGRFVPVAGQTDADLSVQQLSGIAE